LTNRRLILGCGNPDRGDDAAGVQAVRRLRELGVNAKEHGGEALSLIEEWSGAREVIIIDAVVTGSAPGGIVKWDARNAPVSREAFRLSTHGLGVGDAVELARALGRLPDVLMIYGIEAARFRIGEPLSPEVASAVEEVAREIASPQPPTVNN
jgi:hydrogenase maturation protease